MYARAFAIALAVSLGSGCSTTTGPAPSSTEQASRTATLQAVFGPPSQAGFGSAVFAEKVDRPQDLEPAAKRAYRHFLGPRWAEAGEAVWMAPWQRVYARAPGGRATIVAELRAIENPAARSSISMLLDGHEKPDAARQALSAVYDDAGMELVQVYALGDGAALSGVLIAGRSPSGAATLLVFLMD
jgi:hypothetical protein